MDQQSFTNHRRYVPGYHFLAAGLIGVIFIIASYRTVQSLRGGQGLYSGLMPLLISVVLLLFFWYIRAFATRLQDRAIRTEENLRHYVLTGKLPDARLTTSQIIALRFAPDDEYLQLSEQAVNESMKPNDIKKAIKNWKADHRRV